MMMNKTVMTIVLLSAAALFWTAALNTTTADNYLPELEISGSVHDAESGDAIEGAQVMLNDDGESAVTNEYGEFLFSNVEPGLHTLRVDAEGYNATSRQVEVEDDSVAVTIDLYPEDDDTGMDLHR